MVTQCGLNQDISKSEGGTAQHGSGAQTTLGRAVMAAIPSPGITRGVLLTVASALPLLGWEARVQGFADEQ